MKNLNSQVALVTGAGSGIGRATALMLGQEGAHVAVTDIDADSAQRTAAAINDSGGRALAWELDVSDAQRVGKVAREVQAAMGGVSILVNNAGIAVAGYFVESSPESFEKVVAVNLMGVVNCCRAIVPMMVSSDRPGHVVNIASILGQVGMRGVSAYCMTKFGVVGFSESLRAELARHRIGVSTICPGMVRTNIVRNGWLESDRFDVDEKRSSINRLFERRNYPPEKVARAILGAIKRKRGVVPVAPEAWFAYYLKRWMPWLSFRLARDR